MVGNAHYSSGPAGKISQGNRLVVSKSKVFDDTLAPIGEKVSVLILGRE